MATTTERPKSVSSATSHTPRNRDRLQVSAYEQASGLLLACLVLIGFLAGVMGLAWYSTRLWIPQPLAVKIANAPKDVGGKPGGRGDGTGDQPIFQEFDEPAANDPLTPEPKIPTLDAISLAASQPEVLAEFHVGERSSLNGKGKGNKNGDGDDDTEGPGTEPGVPAWERWEVRLNAATTDEYARQLDYFQVELALVGGGNSEVTYISQVAAARPRVRTGNPRDEQRLRFTHRSGVLRAADQKLAAKAGVDIEGKVVVQFYSRDMYQTLLALETTARGARSISAVRRTVFGVKETAGGYEFYVTSQEYR
jgi:hypothetical protein